MATYYVSQTATNGYIVGNDANAGTSKGAAVLTFTQALVLAGNGDTIYLNDGTYTAPGSPGYWTLNENGLTILPETSYGATLAGDGIYAIRLFNINNAAAVTVTMGEIILDGVNITQVGIYCNQTTNLATFVFNGTKFKDFVYTPIKNIHASGYMHVTCNDVIMTGSSWQRGGIHMPNITSGGLVVNGLTVTQSGRINAEGGIVFIHAIAAGVTAKVDSVTATSTLGASAGAFTHNGILIQNIPNAVISNCPNVTISGVGTGSAAATLYEISANTTGVQDSSYGIIENCHGTNATSAGKTALIGADVQAVATQDLHNYGMIIGCQLNGTSIAQQVHGPMLGYGTGGRIMGCTTDYCGTAGLGLLKAMKTGTGPLAVPMSVGNKATHCYSTAAYQKGSSGGIHANNTLITSVGYAPTFELAAYDDTATPDIMGANGIFANNIITGDTCPAALGRQGTVNSAGADTTSGTVFYLSHYDTSLGALANKWTNGDATTYADLATFNTAMTATGYDCVNSALGLNISYGFDSGSAFLGIGYRYWAGTPNPVGSDGEPFSDWDTDIGSMQSTLGSFHPINVLG